MMGGSSGGGGGGQNTQTIQKSDPWAGQQPFLTRGFERAETQLEGTKPQFFPGQTFVGYSPDTQLALEGQRARAIAGSPLVGLSQNQLGRTIAGEYINQPNPAFGAMLNRVENQIRPRIDSQFAGAGRGVGAGSGAGYQEAYARAFADAAAPLAYQNYNQERQNQLQATLAAPQLAQQDYFDAAQLAQVGAAREAEQQAQLSENIQRHNYEQNIEAQKLQQYMNLIQGNYGSMSETQGTLRGQGINPLATGLGLGLTGLGAYGSLFGSGGLFAPAAAGGFSAATLGAAGGMTPAALGAYGAGLEMAFGGVPLALSSRLFKNPRGTAPQVLDKVATLEVPKWQYVHDDPDDGPEHIGPYAEDFRDAFGVGDGVTINYLDAIGVLFKGLQEATIEIRQLRAEIADLRAKTTEEK